MKNFKIRISDALTSAIPRKFWRVSFFIVLGHTLLMSILVSLGLAGWISNCETILREMMSPYDTEHFLMLLFQLLALPLITASSLMAILAFALKRKGRRAHRLLVSYVSLQLGLGLLITIPIVYQYWIGFRQGYSFGWYQFNQFFMVMAGYTMSSVPLLLLVSRGLWIWLIGTPPQTDTSGKYLSCVSCDYDLRGTPGKTCPECGTSAMAVEIQPSS